MPEGVVLSAGMTATVQIDPGPRQIGARCRAASNSSTYTVMQREAHSSRRFEANSDDAGRGEPAVTRFLPVPHAWTGALRGKIEWKTTTSERPWFATGPPPRRTDALPSYTVSIMEFRDGKVARETQYFGDPFEPGPSRAQWVERMP